MGRNPSNYEIHPEKLQMELLNTVVSTKKQNGNIFFGSLWLLVELAVIYIYIQTSVFYWICEHVSIEAPGHPVEKMGIIKDQVVPFLL